MKTRDDQLGDDIPDASRPDTGTDAEGNSEVFEGLLGAFEERGCAELPTVNMEPEDQPGASAGDLIGPYKLLQLIGEGGMGEVWMAEQRRPVARRVALKIIKVGLDTKDVLARFEAERQALAMMEHPHIAHVLDGGTTGQGRPYFVMELVQGVSITEYCNQAKSSTTGRLNLFMQVCDAVQHAHQKGIIHRDIKPSNILVADQDGTPFAKVIDFGVAKAISQRLTERTLFTRYGQMVGTPTYMAPEHAQFSVDDVDTRSDIYSLGCLLYEMLTGDPPFGTKQLHSLAYDEMCRVIREQEPPKPSTRLSTLGSEATVLAQRHSTDARHLGRTIRGDLDWITMQALEKDRNRRYQTANALKLDVQRFLKDEPVSAAAPSAGYRIRKFARRNKPTLTAAVAIALSILLALVFSVSMYLSEREARQLAEEERQTADGERRKAEEAAQDTSTVADFWAEMLEGVGPDVALGRDTTLLRHVLDRTANRMDSELGEQPQIEARLRATIGSVYLALGEDTEAESNFRRAVELNRQLYGSENLQVAQSLHNLARAIVQQENHLFMAAEPIAKEALRVRRGLLPADHIKIAETLAILGQIQSRNGRHDLSESIYRSALEIREAKQGADHVDVAFLLNKFGVVVLESKPAEAERLFRRALEIHRNTLPEEHPDLVSALNNLAVSLQRQGKRSDAQALYEEAFEMGRKMLDDDHPTVALAFKNLVNVLRTQGMDSQLEELCLETRESLHDGSTRLVVAANVTLFNLYARSGRDDSSEFSALVDWLLDQAAFYEDGEAALRLAVYLIVHGQHGKHQMLCERFLDLAERAEKVNDAQFAAWSATALLIHPAAHPDLVERAWKLAESALEQWEDNLDKPGLRVAVGLAHYRRGHEREADPFLVSGMGFDFQEVRATAFAIRAMSDARIEKLAEAKEKLSYAERFLGQLAFATESDLAAVECDWAIAWLLVREARRTLFQSDRYDISHDATVSEVVVSPNSAWRWLHPTDSTDPALSDPDFHQSFPEPQFDDSDWNIGVDGIGLTAGFAYGEREFTGVELGQPEGEEGRYSAYFRHRFQTEREFSHLELSCRRDDGIIVYLDGEEVLRDNVEEGEERYELSAARGIGFADETQLHRFRLNKVLPPGDHVLAISLHNFRNKSSDLRLGGVSLVECNPETATNKVWPPIPKRRPSLLSNLLDLSSYYNRSLEILPYRPIPGLELEGIRFDARGAIQIGRRDQKRDTRHFPPSVNGIVVNRRCKALHFLQSARWGDITPNGIEIGHYLVYYENGDTTKVPLILGRDLADMWMPADQSEYKGLAVPEPRWASDELIGHGTNKFTVFMMTWRNPHPDLLIEKMDFNISDSGMAAPFLAALTAEE